MKKYLLIDDDIDDKELFEEVLTDLSPTAEMLYFDNGEKALDHLESTGSLPDRIFLDINLPMISGWDVLRRIRASERLKNANVIIFTTSSNSREKNIADELGANGFLTKPNDFRELKKCLADFL
jgi:CheY-like chemotaxis protein